jgi:hypothetical protein
MKKKKQTLPLAASVSKRAPPMRMANRPFAEISRGPVPEANTEVGSMSFEGFILQRSRSESQLICPSSVWWTNLIWTGHPERSPIREPIDLPTFSSLTMR